MTNQQVTDHLKQQVKEHGYELTDYEIQDIEATLHSRSWFLEFILEDGKMVVTVLTKEEVQELDAALES